MDNDDKDRNSGGVEIKKVPYMRLKELWENKNQIPPDEYKKKVREIKEEIVSMSRIQTKMKTTFGGRIKPSLFFCTYILGSLLAPDRIFSNLEK